MSESEFEQENRYLDNTLDINKKAKCYDNQALSERLPIEHEHRIIRQKKNHN